jgi:flagellum-specific ATP synthase
MPAVTSKEHRRGASVLREALAIYEKAKDLVNIGAYVAGSNPRIDAALKRLPGINAFLRQPSDEASPFETTLTQLSTIAAGP